MVPDLKGEDSLPCCSSWGWSGYWYMEEINFARKWVWFCGKRLRHSGWYSRSVRVGLWGNPLSGHSRVV